MNLGWMLPKGALEWISENIPIGSSILERSGHGTIELSKNYNVTSIEHDIEWLNLAPVSYIHSPIVSIGNDEQWYDISFLRQIPEEVYLIIIDGPPGEIGRTGILNYLDQLPEFTWILIDDVHREEERNIADKFEEKFKSKYRETYTDMMTMNYKGHSLCY